MKEVLVCSIQIEYSFNLYFFLFSPQRSRGPEGGPEGGQETRPEGGPEERSRLHVCLHPKKHPHVAC